MRYEYKMMILFGSLVGASSGILLNEWWRAIALSVLVISAVLLSSWSNYALYE